MSTTNLASKLDEEAKTYLAVLPEVGGIEIQHDGEDIDIVWTSDGIRPGVIEFEESERWEPHVYTAALLAAGWEIVSDWVLDDGIERVHTAVVRPKR